MGIKILVTGAAGHLGRKLAAHLVTLGHDVTGLDLKAASTPVPIYSADLSRHDAGWATLLEGQDVIIHLAADRSPEASWNTVVPYNIDAVLNLFEAALRAGVPRIGDAQQWMNRLGRRRGLFHEGDSCANDCGVISRDD
jgi:nucleoside-diphosphate-sugar epimerase